MKIFNYNFYKLGGLYVAGGEFESIENLRQNYNFCNDKEIISVQCRNRETNSTEITEDLSCDLNGFKCLNRNIGGKVNSHAVGMTVAHPLGFKIDFVRNPISGSAACFFVIILK